MRNLLIMCLFLFVEIAIATPKIDNSPPRYFDVDNNSSLYVFISYVLENGTEDSSLFQPNKDGAGHMKTSIPPSVRAANFTVKKVFLCDSHDKEICSQQSVTTTSQCTNITLPGSPVQGLTVTVSDTNEVKCNPYIESMSTEFY